MTEPECADALRQLCRDRVAEAARLTDAVEVALSHSRAAGNGIRGMSSDWSVLLRIIEELGHASTDLIAALAARMGISRPAVRAQLYCLVRRGRLIRGPDGVYRIRT